MVETRSTSKSLKSLLPEFVDGIQRRMDERPDQVLTAWPSIIGETLAPMAQAISFERGVLTVKVGNSTLLSLLSQQEKPRLIQRLRDHFPHLNIHNIVFRIG